MVPIETVTPAIVCLLLTTYEDSDGILTAKINNKNIRISNFDYEIG